MSWEVFEYKPSRAAGGPPMVYMRKGQATLNKPTRLLIRENGGRFDIYVNVEERCVGLRLSDKGAHKCPCDGSPKSAAIREAIRQVTGRANFPQDAVFKTVQRGHTGKPFLLFTVSPATSEKERGA